MKLIKKLFLFLVFFLIFIFKNFGLYAEDLDIAETLQLIQKDLKTLEKAVYLGSNFSSNENSNNDSFEEGMLTKHLLKLSDIEKQFQFELANAIQDFTIDNFEKQKLDLRKEQFLLICIIWV